MANMTNASGFTPLDTRVLVLPDPIGDKIGSIIVPQSQKEKEQWAQVKATLIAAGSNAFRDWGSDAAKPEAGARVILNQYPTARVHEGKDGEKYWICNDEDILAMMEG